MSFAELRENERAKRLMAMGRMAANLAHEIRNPLGSMELYCTLLKRDLAGHPTSLELAEQIHAGIKILDRIINNCLQFARDLVVRPKTLINAEQILKDAAVYMQPACTEASVELLIEDRGDYPIRVDPYLVQQALLNVTLNAVDACRGQDGKTVRIVSDRCSRDEWRLMIRDNGPGISDADQEKVFDPFFTTKQGGTGLGLAIVHSIVSAHGGVVSIDSVLGQGTTVVLQFPVSAQTADANQFTEQQ